MGWLRRAIGMCALVWVHGMCVVLLSWVLGEAFGDKVLEVVGEGGRHRGHLTIHHYQSKRTYKTISFRTRIIGHRRSRQTYMRMRGMIVLMRQGGL
jgi:hypothetical protein